MKQIMRFPSAEYVSLVEHQLHSPLFYLDSRIPDTRGIFGWSSPLTSLRVQSFKMLDLQVECEVFQKIMKASI